MYAEQLRLEETRKQKVPWKKWGSYLSERKWGTVRENYSEGAMPGTSSPTTMPARAPTARARTATRAFPMTSSNSALLSSCSCIHITRWPVERFC